MPWRFAPRRHAAVSGADLVLLDLDEGAYACVPGGATLVRACGPRFELHLDNVDLATDLEAAGFIVPGFGLSGPPAVPRPTAQLHLETGPVTLAQAARLGFELVDLARHFHGRSFGRLIAVARHRRRVQIDAADPRLQAEASALFSLLPWIPGQGQCLYRSFLLLRLLNRTGLDATWMFGVRTWPFAAHCWLQVGDTVIDDDLDHVAGYSPILAT